MYLPFQQFQDRLWANLSPNL